MSERTIAGLLVRPRPAAAPAGRSPNSGSFEKAFQIRNTIAHEMDIDFTTSPPEAGQPNEEERAGRGYTNFPSLRKIMRDPAKG